MPYGRKKHSASFPQTVSSGWAWVGLLGPAQRERGEKRDSGQAVRSGPKPHCLYFFVLNFFYLLFFKL